MVRRGTIYRARSGKGMHVSVYAPGGKLEHSEFPVVKHE
jgi:hypothetical protein